MMTLLKRLVVEESAQDLVEYGIALAVIGTLAGAAAVAIGGDVNTLWTHAQTTVDAAVAAI
jgi:Flp pilus assembly pilin Flp